MIKKFYFKIRDFRLIITNLTFETKDFFETNPLNIFMCCNLHSTFNFGNNVLLSCRLSIYSWFNIDRIK